MKTFNENKFKELLLYISDKCELDRDFGAIKLNKILFYSDFLAYASLGHAITGAEYIKLAHGPAPKFMKAIREGMERDRELVIKQRQNFGRIQDRVIPLREIDLSEFSADEIALVDKIIDASCGINATNFSEVSHLEYGWRVADIKETIPYPTAFLSIDKPNVADESSARELALQHGW